VEIGCPALRVVRERSSDVGIDLELLIAEVSSKSAFWNLNVGRPLRQERNAFAIGVVKRSIAAD
jgi:hypothetical protein